MKKSNNTYNPVKVTPHPLQKIPVTKTMTKTNRQTKNGAVNPLNLAKNLPKHIEPIEYSRWAKLAFRDGLTEQEKKEKEDKKVLEDIEKIKSHPWVKVVEDR